MMLELKRHFTRCKLVISHSMFRKSYFILILSLLSIFTIAQEVYEDKTFVDYIASVKFTVKGLPVSLPIADLNRGGQIQLSFDDLEAGYKYYRYKFIHCNKDWTASNIETFDYIDGFEDEELDNYKTSISTKVNYTHYWLDLPNNRMSWTKSGNYVLIIYEEQFVEGEQVVEGEPTLVVI